MKARSSLWLAMLVVTAPHHGAAQRPGRAAADAARVLGQVLDLETKQGIPLAEVRLLPSVGDSGVWEGPADSLGRFASPPVPPGSYRLRFEGLGYASAMQALELGAHQAVEVRAELVPRALELEPVIVVAVRRSRLESSGFYARRDLGFGSSMTRAEIEARGFRRVSDLLRTIPGMRVVPVSGGMGVRMRGGCAPDFVVDGIRLGPVPRVDELFLADDLEGVEVYGPGTAPIQYSNSTCGTVLAWTREGERTGGRPISWGRLGVAAGFILLTLILTH